MSYDLAVFDPRPELRDRSAFDRWYDSTDDETAGTNCDDPSQATPALQAWFHEMRERFVPLNGPYQLDDFNDPRNEHAAEYEFGPDLVYISFGWSFAEVAYTECLRLAEKHGVGFLDVSSADGTAWFPAADGHLEKVHAAAADQEDGTQADGAA